MTDREPYYPCIDDDPHVFTSGTGPAAFSYTSPELVIFCSRCGHPREHLDPDWQRLQAARLDLIVNSYARNPE